MYAPGLHGLYCDGISLWEISLGIDCIGSFIKWMNVCPAWYQVGLVFPASPGCPAKLL